LPPPGSGAVKKWSTEAAGLCASRNRNHSTCFLGLWLNDGFTALQSLEELALTVIVLMSRLATQTCNEPANLACEEMSCEEY